MFQRVFVRSFVTQRSLARQKIKSRKLKPSLTPVAGEASSSLFNDSYKTFLADLSRKKATDDHLRRLAHAISTPEDANDFKEALKMWRTSGTLPPIYKSDVGVIVKSFLGSKSGSKLLEIACNQRLYGVVLSKTEIDKLMNLFVEEALNHSLVAGNEAGDNAERETKHIAVLDNLYKTFALLLYGNHPPTDSNYEALITAGAFGGTEEGWRRSLVSFNEQISLGVPPTRNTRLAIIFGHLQRNQAEEAASVVRSFKKDGLPSLSEEVEALAGAPESEEGRKLLEDMTKALAQIENVQ
ncbi:hypothetical protein HDU97_009073 [Phlyctochytrium planicorne]|nr:hypothetical protein HDU97_009073 [Phlyctochytrium planicorne]